MVWDCVGRRLLTGSGSFVGVQVSSQNASRYCCYDWILTLMRWKFVQVDMSPTKVGGNIMGKQ